MDHIGSPLPPPFEFAAIDPELITDRPQPRRDTSLLRAGLVFQFLLGLRVQVLRLELRLAEDRRSFVLRGAEDILRLRRGGVLQISGLLLRRINLP